MITIYCTTPIYFRHTELFSSVQVFSELGLLNLFREDDCAIWFITPHTNSIFYKLFIAEHLDKDGFIIEGVYKTRLHGHDVNFRLIDDINCKIARRK